MRTLSSAVFLVLMLGSCGLKAPIYIPKDPLLCLGCLPEKVKPKKVKPKVEGQKKKLDTRKPKLEEEYPLGQEKFKYISKAKGQKN